MGAFMSTQHHRDKIRNSTNKTADTTLVALTIQICGFVHEGTLDSRCATKLVRRLRKEADAIAEAGRMTKFGQRELIHAFDTVDMVLRTDDAGLLVTANAAQRSGVGTPPTTQSN